jgi:hypothetical protein
MKLKTFVIQLFCNHEFDLIDAKGVKFIFGTPYTFDLFFCCQKCGKKKKMKD